MFVTNIVWVHLHTIYYKGIVDFKYRHNFVRNVLFDIFRMDRVCVKKETLVKLLTEPYEGQLIFKLADIFVYEWVGEKYAFVDLTRVSLLLGLRT